jgi:uncharacterized spore protein YtfJ
MHELLHSLSEKLQSGASVKSVYGEPIETQGKTIVPVARVAFGFGGGSGKREDRSGGGGGAHSTPLGVIEITPQATRFVPANLERKLAIAALAGFAAGFLYARRRA